MSRIAKKPLEIPTGVDITVNGNVVIVKGKKGEFHHQLSDAVLIQREGNVIWVKPSQDTDPMVGTTRKLLGNMVLGVSEGFERRLQLVGVGYRAKIQGDTLELSLGFSHPVNFKIPTGVTMETPTATDIIIKGADAQVIGEIAAKIRAIRPPEPYNGKGVRYFGEVVEIKETKKK